MGIVIGIIIVGGLILWYRLMSKDQKKIQQVAAAALGAAPSEMYSPFDYGKTALAIDKPGKKICIITAGSSDTKETNVYSHQDIYECEIIVDGETFMKQSTTRTVAGYLVGGALGGIAGAVVGGLSGSKTMKEKIKSITLSMRVNDPTVPTRKVKFLDKEVKKGDPDYQKAITQAEHWHALIANLIEQANRELSASAGSAAVPVKSTNDELEQLFELKEKGVLTEEEFVTAKKKLLS